MGGHPSASDIPLRECRVGAVDGMVSRDRHQPLCGDCASLGGISRRPWTVNRRPYTVFLQSGGICIVWKIYDRQAGCWRFMIGNKVRGAQKSNRTVLATPPRLLGMSLSPDPSRIPALTPKYHKRRRRDKRKRLFVPEGWSGAKTRGRLFVCAVKKKRNGVCWGA